MRGRVFRSWALLQLLSVVPALRANDSAAPVAHPPAVAREWMQAAVDTWSFLCDSKLLLDPDPLPWIIFYDNQGAWHVAPDLDVLPEHAPAGFSLRLGDREIPVMFVAHTHDGGLWVPDRPRLRVAEAKIMTAPYAGGAKSFCICALPSLVQRTLGNESDTAFPTFLLGIVGHEMAHTRQARAIAARFRPLEEQRLVPEHFDENVMESTFGADPEYVRIFSDEAGKLMHTALQDDDEVGGRRLIREALELMRERRARYCTGERAAYAILDDTFLSIEGIGQWVHFQVLRRSAPSDEPWQQTAMRLIHKTDSWVQTEGFALFILIDRYVPRWQDQFFAADLPSPFDVLEAALVREPEPDAAE